MRIRNLRFGPGSVPIALFFFSFISYGMLIPWLGFFWDDWPAVWYLHVFGPQGYSAVFAADRPLLGRLFMLTTSFLGTSIYGWQIFGILARWLCSLAFWWFLKGLWPENIRQVTWAALLFAIYPGFKQQYISVTYSHVWLIALLVMISFGSMIWGLRKPRYLWPMMATSWLLSGLGLFSVEYFFGVELIRPVSIWITLTSQLKDLRSRLKKTLLLWLPYLLIIASFIVWRFLIHPTVRGHVDVGGKLAADPAGALTELLENALVDTFNSSLVAWGQLFNFARMTSFGTAPTLVYLAGIIVAISAAVFFLLKFHPSADQESEGVPRWRWAVQAISLGLLGLLLGGIPFWATNLPIGLEFPWDRFTLAMVFGSCLLLAGLVDLITPNLVVKGVILGVLVGLATGLHLQYSNLYRREWNKQVEFFWQLVWRAPSIQENTLLLTAELPFVYFSDNSLTAPINWTYTPDFQGGQMPYLLYAAESRHEQTLTDFDPGIPIHQQYRATTFEGNTSQSLVLFYTPPGCLKVVDPATDKRMPQKPKFISDMMPLSDPSRIIAPQAPGAHPPEKIFGEEPPPSWCYYFEKAELARQTGDWEQVASLADRALGLGNQLYEVNAPELVTYIEGYAQTGQWDKAVQVNQRTFELSARMDRMLCDTWERIETGIPASSQKEAAIASVNDQISCTSP